MRIKTLFLALLVMFAGVVTAQVESGKVYRIVSSKYGTVITANPISNALSCVTEGSETDYQQMWEFTLDETSGKYSIQNVFSRLYIQNESVQNVAFKTGNSIVLFDVKENEELPGNYNIDASNRADGWGLHCASGASVVPWRYGPDDDGISGTEWTFKEVSNITDADKELAYEEFIAYNEIKNNKEVIIEKINAIFEDNAGTVLKEEYASMSDDELVAALEGVPADLQQAVLKIKNNTWAVEERENLSEKNFRVFDYKPYSDPDKWKDVLYHRPFNRINNPTGICSETDKAYLYVFVDTIPEGSKVILAEMSGTAYFGTETELTVGLNVIPSAAKNGVLYVRYVVDTDFKGKKLSDYPNVKVHIEGGYVNGFWSKERGHTNEDWVYMGQKMFRNPEAVQAVGDHTVLNFRKKEFLQPFTRIDEWGFRVEGCPEDITGVMKFWDFWNERQRHYMGLDKYYDWFNNKQLAMSDDGGFMDAGNYRTHYNNNTLTTIVNIDRISRDGGSAWGPNHEIGHTNQYAFEIVGTSEVSNNALANFAIFDTGTHTSRGNNLENQIYDFENNVPYVVRGEKEYGQKLFSMTRMYFQLFLYFHAAGKKTDFYPILFEELRNDRLVGWGTRAQDEIDPATGYYKGSMDAANDQLKFVEKCCSIAQMDLTEFFEAWGFFIPMKNAYVGDYGHHYVYLTQESIDACKARIKAANYPKKGGHLMFIEDRIRPSKKMKSLLNDDDSGYREDYSWEVPVGANTGLYGQWADYIDESVEAQGYYYAVSDGVVTIIKADGAKGALGFKLYDADTDKLLTYTNKEQMNIPVANTTSNLRVVAAQANGEDYVIPHASQGPESMQLEALSKSLGTARKYTLRKNKDGNAVGYFYTDSVQILTDLYNEAKIAYDNRDTSVRSYAEWSIMLDNECRRLITTEGTRVMFEEGMEVNIYSTKGKLTNSYMGLITSTNSSDSNPESRWSVEYAGAKDVYYLKNAEGEYVKDFQLNGKAYADIKSTVGAARFTITYTEDGNLVFSKVGGTDVVALGEGNNSINVDGEQVRSVMGTSTGANAEWIVWVYRNNSAEFYKNELDAVMKEAHMVITEVLNLDSLNTVNIFNNSVIVKDRNLETYAIDLYNHYLNVITDVDNVAKHKSYLNTFRELLKNINGTYLVATPIATAGDRIAWYRLKDNESGDYLGVYSGTSASNKERLVLVDEDDLDDTALWAFAATGKQNEFKIYNCSLKGYISSKAGKNERYLFVTDGYMPLTVEYNIDNNAVAVKSNNENYPYLQPGSYVNLNKKSNAGYWTLELVLLENDDELANDIITIVEGILEEGNYDEDCYDLSGRKVVNPGKGIYIQNGKKVLFK